MSINWLKLGLIGLGAILLIALVFGVGFFAGRLSERNLFPVAPFLQRGVLGRGEHGAVGAIDEIRDRTITLTMRDGGSQQIITDHTTRFERNLKKITLSDLKVGDRIIVVGAPDPDGKLKARVIRIVDRRAPTPPLRSQ